MMRIIGALLAVAVPALLTDPTPRFVLPGDVGAHVGKPVIVCGVGAGPAQAGDGRVTFTIGAYESHRPGSALASIASRIGDDAGRFVGRNVCATGIARMDGGRPYVEVASIDHVVDDPLMQGVALARGDVLSPRPLRRGQPRVTGDQIRRVHGRAEIGIQVVVLPNGVPGPLRVVRSTAPEMEAETLEAVKRWEFAPALRAGAPVPCLFYVEVTFSSGGRKQD
ncbi:MAG: hypothetical protein A3H96_07420 [Acidobacteria bacterium RIFCSPLOWO2_02_FULL_67_36]|nr:MAG: hypothetical protein A3H96_07420 [Acidobacteria bacterium RIFCSPLOWO2_02_FULL_67_36]OFW23656.1 MAG: hypothetical protein A3G21_07000 [Acidobacteria bacterium RIFCSPLOWO2_12_FULL_66_21]